MNKFKTLSEIRKELGVSRKVIQGYEKHGLISPCGKDKYGHLIYDAKTIETIIMIRFYQKLGFLIKEIKELLFLDGDKMKEAIAKKRKENSYLIDSLSKKQLVIDYLMRSGEKPHIEFMLNIVKEDKK